jgi:hypothetical protein
MLSHCSTTDMVEYDKSKTSSSRNIFFPLDFIAGSSAIPSPNGRQAFPPPRAYVRFSVTVG